MHEKMHFKCIKYVNIFQPPYAQVASVAQDQLSTLLKAKFDSILLKSPTYMGMANLFEVDIPTTGAPIACKLYPIPLKNQKFIVEEI